MDKQIKEMAKVIRPVLENRVDIGFIPDLAKPIAKELLKHYQPKIPEGSVVISKEEYEQLSVEYKRWEKLAIEDLLTQARKQAVKEFAEKLKMQFEHCLGTFYPTDTIERRIDKIAKEFGVEL